tara:strand:- start:168 stop:560 length:393 start_codon:yes stop_codon:yes gene_type:complete
MDYKTLYEQSQKELAGLKSVIEVITPEIDELKKENEKLKEFMKVKEKMKIRYRTENIHNEKMKTRYRLENEKLKECIKNKDFVIDELVEQKIKRSKQCKELKKENEELKKENEKMKAFINELKINVVKLD